MTDVEKSKKIQMTDVEKSEMLSNMEKFQISLHDGYEDTLNLSVKFIQDGNGDISFNEFVWLMTK